MDGQAARRTLIEKSIGYNWGVISGVAIDQNEALWRHRFLSDRDTRTTLPTSSSCFFAGVNDSVSLILLAICGM